MGADYLVKLRGAAKPRSVEAAGADYLVRLHGAVRTRRARTLMGETKGRFQDHERQEGCRLATSMEIKTSTSWVAS